MKAERTVELHGQTYQLFHGEWFMAVHKGEVRDRETGRMRKALLATPVRSSHVLKELRRETKENRPRRSSKPSVVAVPPTPPTRVAPRSGFRLNALAGLMAMVALGGRRSTRGR